MTIEQLLDHIKNHTKSLLAMGIGRYEANAKGSAGFWHIAGQELKAAINEISFPTLFYSFSFADNWNTELFNILPFPKGMSRDSYNDRKKVLTNNLHLAAWFYYRKATEFSIQMRKVLQAEWYWERVEAQFRTTLHTHGCLKMRNDNELLQNTHKALLGKLAQERVEHLRNGLSIEPTVAPLLPENTFPEQLTANAKVKMTDTIREVLKNFIDDYATHVAFEQDNDKLESP